MKTRNNGIPRQFIIDEMRKAGEKVGVACFTGFVGDEAVMRIWNLLG